jgi:hypothetical protein
MSNIVSRRVGRPSSAAEGAAADVDQASAAGHLVDAHIRRVVSASAVQLESIAHLLADRLTALAVEHGEMPPTTDDVIFAFTLAADEVIRSLLLLDGIDTRAAQNERIAFAFSAILASYIPPGAKQ